MAAATSFNFPPAGVWTLAGVDAYFISLLLSLEDTTRLSLKNSVSVNLSNWESLPPEDTCLRVVQIASMFQSGTFTPNKTGREFQASFRTLIVFSTSAFAHELQSLTTSSSLYKLQKVTAGPLELVIRVDTSLDRMRLTMPRAILWHAPSSYLPFQGQ